MAIRSVAVARVGVAASGIGSSAGDRGDELPRIGGGTARDVVPLVRIPLEVEYLQRRDLQARARAVLREGRDDDLEVAVPGREAIGPVLHRFGEHGPRGGLRSGEKRRRQVDPPVLWIRGKLRQRQQRWGYVEQADGSPDRGARLNHARLPDD